MLLHPAGFRVTDPDSALEGEVCSWARPERPHLPDGWEAEQGAAAAAAAAAMTALASLATARRSPRVR